MTEEMSKAASLYRIGRYRNLGIEPQYVWSDIDAAFEAGAAWQKEREMEDPMSWAEMRNTLATLAEGLAKLLQGQQELSAAGLRGADRGVAVLKHLQEIGDNVRGVGSAIGDKFGVVLDTVKDVGEKVEACISIASNTEEGLAVSIDKLNKLGVEKWREAIKHVETEGITEPMHAEVKAADYDESGLGKLWADVTVNLEDVSDETLDDLHRSEQIGTARYVEERGRRIAAKIDLGEGLVPRVEADNVTFRPGLLMRDGEVKFIGATAGQFAVVELSSGAVIILWEGLPYMLRGTDLHPLSFVA